ncbi:MAG: YdcF family protein [Bacteroidia bacterium]|nr:YdcF family protein [Bacteroidia bacterium]
MYFWFCMFFILSKILAFIITPIVWIITLLCFAVFSKDEKRRKKSLRWALGLLLFFSNSFIFDEVVRLWEVPATVQSEMKQYDYAILLGGMSVHDEELNRVQYYRGVDRLIQTIDLYKKGYVKKIILTSGSGRILKPEMKEGLLMKPYILNMGVAEEDLYVEHESNNTRENAAMTKQLIDSLQLKGSYLIVTSAFHMRRGLGCFKKVGIEADHYSTDRYAGPRKFEFDHLFIPSISAVHDWNVLIHEVVGYITYKLMGYA